jgi:hypothetical protein
MKIEGWNVLAEDACVLWREYAFGRGAFATTLVFRGTDGLVVVSPPTKLSDRDYDALAELGDVRALVANNSFHHMGQAAWRARFPDAVSYGPKAAIERLTKRSPGVNYRPLEDLLLPPHVRCDVPPGYRQGEAIFTVKTRARNIWFSGDLLTNIERVPGPPVKWLFRWTDSAPGFRLFKPAVWILIKDRGAVREWMLDRLASDPPSVVVPAHGAPFDAVEVATQVKLQLERL